MLACKAKTIPDSIFMESARALSLTVSELDLARGSIYPPLEDIRETSLNIAVAVAKFAYANGLTDMTAPPDLRHYIQSLMYVPEY